jgi:hypothetical protein
MILNMQMYMGWWQWQWQQNAGDDGGDSVYGDSVCGDSVCGDSDGDDGCNGPTDHHGKGVCCCVLNLLIPGLVLEVQL